MNFPSKQPNQQREPWKQGFFYGHEFAFSLMAQGNEKARQKETQ